MGRRHASITQADVARVIRAAQQTGAGAIEVRPDGTILILLNTTESNKLPAMCDEDRDIVL